VKKLLIIAIQEGGRRDYHEDKPQDGAVFNKRDFDYGNSLFFFPY
jgi:hypothetical protein